MPNFRVLASSGWHFCTLGQHFLVTLDKMGVVPILNDQISLTSGPYLFLWKLFHMKSKSGIIIDICRSYLKCDNLLTFTSTLNLTSWVVWLWNELGWKLYPNMLFIKLGMIWKWVWSVFQNLWLVECEFVSWLFYMGWAVQKLKNFPPNIAILAVEISVL